MARFEQRLIRSSYVSDIEGGSRLLHANAGSGKTTVVVERFAHAVVEDGVDPRRILAITFTEKAAGELRRRLRQRLAELGHGAPGLAAEGAQVSTIHGFCAGVLRGQDSQISRMCSTIYPITSANIVTRVEHMAFCRPRL